MSSIMNGEGNCGIVEKTNKIYINLICVGGEVAATLVSEVHFHVIFSCDYSCNV